MQEFNLQIFHKPGKEMIVPDALSRMFGGTQVKQEAKTVQKSIIRKMSHQKSFR